MTSTASLPRPRRSLEARSSAEPHSPARHERGSRLLRAGRRWIRTLDLARMGALCGVPYGLDLSPFLRGDD
jgi:hypothetical protein